jgi:hypothetical protein
MKPQIQNQLAVWGEFTRINLHVYLPEGTNVISCHKQLEFLYLYSGRRRVTLAPVQQLLETAPAN